MSRKLGELERLIIKWMKRNLAVGDSLFVDRDSKGVVIVLFYECYKKDPDGRVYNWKLKSDEKYKLCTPLEVIDVVVKIFKNLKIEGQCTKLLKDLNVTYLARYGDWDIELIDKLKVLTK